MTAVAGAVVVVTGGQRGLGKALADEFLEQGAAKVYVTAREPVPPGHPLVVSLPLDVNDPTSVAALAAATPDATIVVNNAGASTRGAASTADLSKGKELFETNVFGPLRVAQAYAPILQRNGGGALVNIASVLSWAAGSGLYGASKAALWSLTNSLRVELRQQGTQVVGVHLGYTDTDMTRALDVVKEDPRTVARYVVEGVAQGRSEVLADLVSRQFKAVLSGPVEGLSWSVVDGVVVLADLGTRQLAEHLAASK